MLLGELGAEAYRGLWDGTTDWESAEVIAALDMYTQVLEHSNLDAAAADWQPAIDPIIEGDAAYNVMGDWADTYFRIEKKLAWEPVTTPRRRPARGRVQLPVRQLHAAGGSANT